MSQELVTLAGVASRPDSRSTTAPLFAVFTATGASALALQVVWQRVLTLHTGVDLTSVTTVIASFMAGLGLGNLAGGRVADRLSARGCILAFAACNVGIALYAGASIWLLHDAYSSLIRTVDHPAVGFFLHTCALLVPTVLMGASLPLLARGAVMHSKDIALVVGRLYAVNTLGAAAGAALTAWVLMGTFGLSGTVRLAAAVNLLAAVTVALWARGMSAPDALRPARPIESVQREEARTAWGWMALYALTGAVALGFEIVFFRVIDSVLRSNSYSFGHVLGLYLLLFAGGAAVGSKIATRTRNPARAFLLFQVGVAISALVGVMVLVHMPPIFGMRRMLTRYFETDGFATGFHIENVRQVRNFVFAHVFAPLLIMGVPVFCMGAAFPCVQAVVARDLSRLGRQTGTLLFSNLCGNFLGSVATGFLLIDALGTMGTLKALSLVLGGTAIVALWHFSRGLSKRPLRIGLAALTLAGAAWAAPSQEVFWSQLRATESEHVSIAEDHACATMLVHGQRESSLFINGASQNGYPYDDFHVLIGLTPSLIQSSPRRGLSIGFGIGATPFAMAQDRRLELVDNVELCGGEHALARELARRGSNESRFLMEEPRIRLHVADGRRFMKRSSETWDVITADAGRPTSQASGNLHSREFYELIRDHLAPAGVFAQWIPTDRTLQTVKSVFPFVVELQVPSYFGSRFLMASRVPILWERDALLERLSTHPALSAVQYESLRKYYASHEPTVAQSGAVASPPEERINRDLFPRDEFFLNNSP